MRGPPSAGRVVWHPPSGQTEVSPHPSWMPLALTSAKLETFVAGEIARRVGILLHTGRNAFAMGDRLFSAPIDILWRR